jgi:2-succinyl-5-enolpyruvyl-6-hydroxy-3-cyclohexene-1-carboxylate synthase
MIDATNRNTALASALVEELARCGIRRAFLSPGSRSSPIALALDREVAIELTVILDERVAGFAALGAALATGEPAIVACTSGSAAANLHPAVAEADQAGVPMILLTSDRPPELRGIGAGQTIDQIGLYGTAPRWFCEVGTNEADDTGLLHLRSTACRAHGEAMSGRGPVHLNLAWRDPLGPDPCPEDVTAGDPLALDGRSLGRPLTVAIDSRAPDEDLLAALSLAVERAERGVIVAGRLTDDGLSASLVELAELAGLPILAEPTSQLRFGRHDRSAAIAAYDLISRSRPPSLEPDLVLRFGDMPTSKPLRAWLATSDADQIVIDPPGRWNEPSRRAGAFVRADAGAVIAGICSRIPQAEAGWKQGWVDAEAAAQRAIDAVLSDAGDAGLNEPGVQRLLGDIYGEGERVLLASSMPIRDAEAFLAGSDAEVRFHANRGANGIDGLVATGSGIALASGDPTWIVLGDLALAHDLGGLAAATSVDTPIRIVVVDNGGGGIFDFLPQAAQVEPSRFADLFTTPANLEVERVAGLFGLPYVRVEDEAALSGLGAVDRVLAHVPVERQGNVELHARLAAAVASAIEP